MDLNPKFLSYTPTPQDQWMIGVASVLVYGKVILRFKHATKDGKGEYFVPASYSLTDEYGTKSYVSCFELESRSDEAMLLDFVKANVKVARSRGVKQSDAMVFPNGPLAGTQVPQAVEQNLPF